MDFEKLLVCFITLVASIDSSGVSLFRRHLVLTSRWDAATKTSINVRSPIQCGGACFQTPSCTSFAFDPDSGVCETSEDVGHRWHVDDQAGDKFVHLKIGDDFEDVQIVTKIGLQTGPSEYDDCTCDLHFKICVDGSCCVANSGSVYHGYSKLVLFESSGLGSCQNFAVSDYRDAAFYIYQIGSDGWDGTEVNVWFNGETKWSIRCLKVGGGEIVVNTSEQQLECSFYNQP